MKYVAVGLDDIPSEIIAALDETANRVLSRAQAAWDEVGDQVQRRLQQIATCH